MAKLESTEISPHICIASPIINIPHWSITLVTTDEPTLTCDYHPKSIAYIRDHSWCCIFCGFGQILNDIYLPLQYHKGSFVALKILCSAYSFLSPQPLSLFFPKLLVLISFAFFYKIPLRKNNNLYSFVSEDIQGRGGECMRLICHMITSLKKYF